MSAYKPLPKTWSDKAKMALLNTPDRQLTSEFPQYSYRQLVLWKGEIRKERDIKLVEFRDGKLNQKQIDIWVSQAELQRRKKQEYNEAMGLTHDVLSGAKVTEHDAVEKVASYLTKLASDEDAWRTQRTARSVSISAANDLLLWKHVEQRIETLAKHIRGRPKGYARKKAKPTDLRRVLNCLWTDHHNGASLPKNELPVGYDEAAQRRRFAHLLRNALDYKLDHRPHTVAHIYDAGDNMEGYLGHDFRSGEPLAEQFAQTLEYRIQATEHLAAQFPEVHIWIDAGNHDRHKFRHPGRATYQKWDSFQHMLGAAWRAACRSLENVHFHMDKRPYSAVDVMGHWHYITHGDTHFNLGNPGKSIKMDSIIAQMNSINATERYGHRFSVFAAGHVHTSVQIEAAGADLFINSALCPSSGHADACGYSTDASQWMWETTEKHAVGDIRRVKVGIAQDTDVSLDAVIAPAIIWED